MFSALNIKGFMDQDQKKDRRQRIYNNIGILLVIGIIGGTGLLFIKYSDDGKEPIKIVQPQKTDIQTNSEVKGGQTDSGQARMTAKININTADLQDLDKLQGIGPATAQKIIDWRNQNGLFKVLEDLKKVPGIGESKFEQIKNQVSL